MRKSSFLSWSMLFLGGAFLSSTGLLTGCAGSEEPTDNGSSVSDGDAEKVSDKCDYPLAPTTIKTNDYMPALAWLQGANEEGVETRIDMVDFYCNDDEWGSYDSLAVYAFPTW